MLVCVCACWGKGVLLGVAPVLVYTAETDRYLNVSILKSVGEVLMIAMISWRGLSITCHGDVRGAHAPRLFSLSIMPVPEVHLS